MRQAATALPGPTTPILGIDLGLAPCGERVEILWEVLVASARGVVAAAAPDSKVSSAAYPTEERIRWKGAQKTRKAKGVPVVKRTQVIEDHWDDCGQDLSGLAAGQPR